MPEPRSNDRERATMLGMKSWVSIETLVVAAGLLSGLFGIWLKLEVGSARQRNATEAQALEFSKYKTEQAAVISELRDYAERQSGSIEQISKTLDGMLLEARVNNEIEKMRIWDRWTAAMMAEYRNNLYTTLSAKIPGLQLSDFPDVDAIQNRFISKMRTETAGP